MKKIHSTKSPSRKQIQRTVASSTAIETGTPVKTLEALLKKQESKFRRIKLAS
jgi:hypothetical protein